MIWPLMKLDLRKTLPAYLATVAVLTGFILITRDILDSANIFVLALTLIQGWLLAWRIFCDSENTRPFLFSRPWSPARMFWNRWALAVILQITTVLLIAAILAAGTRTAIHQRNVPYFPMVERFELSILWPIAAAPAVTFHITMLFMLRGMVLRRIGAGKGRALIAKAVIGLVLMMFLAGLKFRDATQAGVVVQRIGNLVLIYAAVLAVLCTAASLNCYKNMEIES